MKMFQRYAQLRDDGHTPEVAYYLARYWATISREYYIPGPVGVLP